jgi:hypothetical protein
MERGSDGRGPCVSGVEGAANTLSGFRLLGRGLLQGLGRMVPPGPFSYFLFLSLFFSSFLKCFIEFANLIQIISNKILNTSNFQSKVLNQ